MPRALTHRQRQVLVAIVGLAGELGRLPTWREIGSRVAAINGGGPPYFPHAVTGWLLALARKGYVEYEPLPAGGSHRDAYRVLGLRMAPTVTADAAGDALRGVLGADAGGDCPLPGLVAIEED